ncbi:MAG: hypothetical protein JWO95_2710 [Verrucomicrobiales bacterium]|nr:hypothetical protein [Verrucomicrobiales bacterium]
MWHTKPELRAIFLLFVCFTVSNVSAHFIGDPTHDQLPLRYAKNVTPPTNVVVFRAKSGVNNHAWQIGDAFAPFAPHVKTHFDEKWFFVESDGLPAHNMMVGITAWQQQVPLPQSYFGDNAWRFPLAPVPAAQPRMIKGNFLSGAIAIAVNGAPIFNPQNNRGEVSAQIGELDQWGGHCGRADDYHYHAAPLHLQKVVGPALPIAYALDGYAIYGLLEPNGAAPLHLDSCNGHTTPALGYHYHASLEYPYINGGFHAEVVEADGQVDPQPRAQGVRPALQPLRGAEIVSFTNSVDRKSFSLGYTVNNRPGGVNYTNTGGGQWTFQFLNTDGTTRANTYSARQGRPGEGVPPQQRANGNRPHPRERSGPQQRQQLDSSSPPLNFTAKHSGSFLLTSSAVTNGGALPQEFNGDGAGISPPVEWKGAPAGTKSFVVVMDHLAPGNEMKCYWTMWDIPATTTNLPKNVRNIGRLGGSFRGRIGYEPPHSQGPGLKTYTIHVYAVSATPQFAQSPSAVTRDDLLNAIKDTVLDSAELKVTYTRPE